MTSKFEAVSPYDLPDNPFKAIGKQWMLITAGTSGDFNTMTAAWGGMGFLWNMPVTWTFIRPQRFTFGFAENYDHYTLTFFDKEYRDVLKICGTTSGRDTDKIAETGLKPLTTENGNVFFEQCRLMIECRKIYFDDIKPDFFLDPAIQKNYPVKDYHRMYIGEVFNCLVKA